MLVTIAVSGLTGLEKENFVGKDVDLEVGKTGQKIWGGQGETVSQKQVQDRPSRRAWSNLSSPNLPNQTVTDKVH